MDFKKIAHIYKTKYAQHTETLQNKDYIDKELESKLELLSINSDIREDFEINISEEPLIKIHKLWYKINESKKYNISKEIVESWKEELSALAFEKLTKIQKAIIFWFSTHNYKNKESMWLNRLNYNILISEEMTNNEENPSLFYILQMSIPTNDAKIDEEEAGIFIDKYLLDKEFVESYMFYYYGQDLEQYLEDYYYEENDDDDEEEERTEIKVTDENIVELFKEHFVDNNGNIEFLRSIDYDLNFDLKTKKKAAKFLASKGQSFLDRINNTKIGYGEQYVSFEEVSDIVYEQMKRNEMALNSRDINSMVTAISLSLNLEHNFGNLLADHTGNDFDKDFLDFLSNMDMEEEDNELKELGFNSSDLYEQMGKPEYQKEFDLQHDYYKQKELDRIQRIMNKNPDKTVKELDSVLSPQRGASFNWKNNFISIFANEKNNKNRKSNRIR